MKLLWRVETLDVQHSGLRYRALLPAYYLARDHGVESAFCDMHHTPDPSGYDAMAFIETLREKDLLQMERARQAGKKIVLCMHDNVFYERTDGGIRREMMVQHFIAAQKYIDALVTTGPALTEVLRSHCAITAPVFEIPDGFESEADIQAAVGWFASLSVVQAPLKARALQWLMTRPKAQALMQRARQARGLRPRHLIRPAGELGRKVMRACAGQAREYIKVKPALDRLRAKIGALPPSAAGLGAAVLAAPSAPPAPEEVKTILWFGNAGLLYYHSQHSNPHFGFSTILDIAADLERLYREVPFRLVVASSKREAYEAYIKPLPFPTEFVQWTLNGIYDCLRAADVVILPNSRDAFSTPKSPNRAILALGMGTPVVATSIASMKVFEGAMLYDRWYDNLKAYLTDPELAAAHTARAQALIAERFAYRVIAAQWHDALSQILAKPAAAPKPLRMANAPCRLMVVMDLVQDLDVLLPVILAARAHPGVEPLVVVSGALTARSPRVLRTLLHEGIVPDILSPKKMSAGVLPDLKGIDAVLTAETSAGPHKRLFRVAERARALGLATYAVQHGFENIGITYFDQVHGPEIGFASEHVFTWSAAAPSAPEENREKFIPVGCPKVYPQRPPALPVAFDPKRTVLVLENLHWHRYSTAYRERFLLDLCVTAAALPELRFVLKPHHAGMWASRHLTELMPVMPANIAVISPGDPAWEPFTAPDLLTSVAAAITTPSTTALDAALMGVPVAVAAYDLELPLYDGLPLLRDIAEWKGFVQEALNSPAALTSGLTRFVDRALVRRDAAQAIVDHIAAPYAAAAGKRVKKAATA